MLSLPRSKNNMRTFILFVSLSFIAIVSKAQEGCALKKNAEGIKVYLCETEDSAFKTIKVEFEANTSLSEYAAGLLDVSTYKYWQYNIIEPTILKRINEKELIYYCEVDTPWPISNRDLIFHLKMDQDSVTKTLVITLTQLPGYIPEKEGIVRIPKAESILTVTPISETRVSVKYVLQVDPGGEVPAFLANMFAAQTPYQTYKNYRNRLESVQNDTVYLPFIKNFSSEPHFNNTHK